MEKSNTIISIQNIITKLKEDQTVLVQKLDEYNKKLENITQALKSIVIPNKTLTIENIDEETLSTLITAYNIPDNEYVNALKFLKVDNNKKFLPNSYEIELNKIKRVIKVINSITKKLTEEQKKLNKNLESIQQEKNKITSKLEINNTKLSFYTKLLEYLTLTTVDEEKIKEIKTFILTTNLLNDAEKAKIIQEICKNIIVNLKNKTTKENTSLTVFEEALGNIEEGVTDKNKDILPSVTEVPEEIAKVIEEIKEYIQMYGYSKDATFPVEEIQEELEKEIDKELISYLISACIIKIYELIEKKDTKENIKVYIDCFHKLKEKTKTEEIKEKRLAELTIIKENLEQKNFSDFYYTFYYKLEANDLKEGNRLISTINNFLNKIKRKIETRTITKEEYEELIKQYNEIELAINCYYEKVNPQATSTIKKEFKGFVIAEILDNGEVLETTVKKDLKTKPLIDKSSSLANWKEQYSLLIDDLVYEAIPTALASSESNVGNRAEKLDDIVYFDKQNRDNPTGMHRYRPSRLSNIRFVERKIILEPTQPIFNQVKSIILKYFPNAQINDKMPFTLFINFANGIKIDDTDIYQKSITRLQHSKLMEIFHEDGKYRKNPGEQTGTLKTSLNDEELKILEYYIKSTIESFRELNNDDFNITFINSETKKERRK